MLNEEDDRPDTLCGTLGSSGKARRRTLSPPAGRLHEDTALYAVEREAAQDYYNDPPDRCDDHYG